jgi:hypothetical protein
MARESFRGRISAEALVPAGLEDVPRRRLGAAAARRAVFAASGIALFVLALETIKGGASGVVPLLDGLSVEGPANAVGFGWLMAYGALSGSPVAAVGVSLLSGGVLEQSEAFAVIAGSRLGASFIVLAVGYLMYLSRRRNADGLYIGVVALLTTFSTQGPATAVGLVSLHLGWLDGVSFATPGALTDSIGAVVDPPVDAMDALLPAGLLFLAGIGILLGSFWLFDRALPQLEGEAEGMTRILHVLSRRPLMFLMGAGITAITMSVSISLTVLVPLSMKGYVRRDSIIPYVMGANITTFIDTLFASVLLGGDVAFTVVLTQMVSIAAVSALLLTLFYRPYSAGVLASARWVTARPRHFATFLVAIVGVPLVLLLV